MICSLSFHCVGNNSRAGGCVMSTQYPLAIILSHPLTTIAFHPAAVIPAIRTRIAGGVRRHCGRITAHLPPLCGCTTLPLAGIARVMAVCFGGWRALPRLWAATRRVPPPPPWRIPRATYRPFWCRPPRADCHAGPRYKACIGRGARVCKICIGRVSRVRLPSACLHGSSFPLALREVDNCLAKYRPI